MDCTVKEFYAKNKDTILKETTAFSEKLLHDEGSNLRQLA